MAQMIENVDVALPRLPESIQQLRVAHLTDLHVARSGRGRYRHLLEALEQLEADIVLLTGDYMCHPGDEPAALRVMQAVCDRLNPQYGTFGVYGNHDSHTLRKDFDALPVNWLANQAITLPDVPIQLLGFENDRYTKPDTIELMLTMNDNSNWNGSGSNGTKQMVPGARAKPVLKPSPAPALNANLNAAQTNKPAERPIRLLLSHYPTMLPTASDLDVDIMFSGHTHGGQWRLPGKRALYTSCDLPGHLAAGILRHRHTLGVVSRGIGETWIPLRFFCKPQVPVFTLTRGELPGVKTDCISNAMPW